MHVERHQPSVLLQPIELIGQRAISAMLQIARQRDDVAIDVDMFVDLAIAAPAAAASVEQAQHPIGIRVAMTQKSTEILRRARKAIACRGKIRVLDRRAQLRCDAFVGIQTQHPVVLRRAHCEILLLAISLERMRDDRRPECDGALRRAVFRSGVDDEDFLAKCERTDAILDAVGFVECDDAGRDRRTGVVRRVVIA